MRFTPPISIKRRSVPRCDLPPKTILVIQLGGRRFHLDRDGYSPKVVLQTPEYAAATAMEKWGRRARILNLVVGIASVAAGAVLGVPALLTLTWLVFLLLTAIFTFGRLEVAHANSTAVVSSSTRARVSKSESADEDQPPNRK